MWCGKKGGCTRGGRPSVNTQANLFFRKCFIAPIYRPDVAAKSKMSAAEMRMSQKQSCAEVKNSPDPFGLSLHRLDHCEICRFHLPCHSRRCLHQWNVFIGAPFFVLSVRSYEDLLHVQNKCLAIRLSEGKTGKTLSSLPCSVVVATFREDTNSEPTCTDAQNLFL